MLAAKLTKSNMKAVEKAIAARLDTIQGSVAVTDTSISWTCGHITEQERVLKLGQYLVMMNAWAIPMSAHEFKWKYEEISPHLPSYYTPTDNEVKIIKYLTSDEYYYGYDYICDETGLDQATAKQAIDQLRSVGVVRFARGLMNDDGEVAGSGFGIRNTVRAEALLYRYYQSNSHSVSDILVQLAGILERNKHPEMSKALDELTENMRRM